jgi:xanthine dehydrogenase accessory factor
VNPFVGLFRSLENRLSQRRRVAICTIVAAQGSTPQSPGATMLLHADMSTEGTLGGGCVEAEVRKRAFELLERGQSDVLGFKLDHDYGWDDGLICGGSMKVAVVALERAEQSEPFAKAAAALERGEPASVPLILDRTADAGPDREAVRETYRLHIEPPARLIIAGAGHVGAELARLAVGLDFEVRVIDDRADLLGRDRLPPPITPVVGDIEQALRGEVIDAGTYVVIVTRGHNHDEQALNAVIRSPAIYLGMIGSRRKIKLIFDDLAELGVERSLLDRVHAPIGLPIGSVTVPEIAVSIAAQLIQVRRRNRPTWVEGPIPVSAGA